MMQGDIYQEAHHYQNQNLNFISETLINDREKADAAIIFERSLSCILARNFIQCWDQLKRNYYDNNKFVIKQSIRYRQENGVTLDQVQNHNISRQRYHSNKSRVQRIKHQERLIDESSVFRRNKSIRLINSHTEQSRANVLNEIVEKLKAHKKSAENNDDEDNAQIYRKISRLEALIRSIKLEQSRENTEPNNYERIVNIQQKRKHYKKKESSSESESQDEEDKLLQQFMSQVLQIRKQIAQIKQNNQVILKKQLQKSRASSREQINTNPINYHEKFEAQVLKHDTQIQTQLKQLQKKVDMILQQIKSGNLNIKNITTESIFKKEDKYNYQEQNNRYNSPPLNNLDNIGAREFPHKHHNTVNDFSQQTEQKYPNKPAQEDIKPQINPDLEYQNQALKKIQQNINQMVSKIETNRIQIQNQKKRSQQYKNSVSILPLTHKTTDNIIKDENENQFKQSLKEDQFIKKQKEDQYDYNTDKFSNEKFEYKSNRQKDYLSDFKSNQISGNNYNTNGSAPINPLIGIAAKFGPITPLQTTSNNYKFDSNFNSNLNIKPLNSYPSKSQKSFYNDKPFISTQNNSNGYGRANFTTHKTNFTSSNTQQSFSPRPFLPMNRLQSPNQNYSSTVNYTSFSNNMPARPYIPPNNAPLPNDFRYRSRTFETNIQQQLPPSINVNINQKNFCSCCGRACSCLPVPGFVKKKY